MALSQYSGADLLYFDWNYNYRYALLKAERVADKKDITDKKSEPS